MTRFREVLWKVILFISQDTWFTHFISLKKIQHKHKSMYRPNLLFNIESRKQQRRSSRGRFRGKSAVRNIPFFPTPSQPVSRIQVIVSLALKLKPTYPSPWRIHNSPSGNIEYTCPASNDCEINKRRRKACQVCESEWITSCHYAKWIMSFH